MSPYLLILISYLVGSVPFGLAIGQIFFKKDVREHGSGNTGASNVLRTFGKPAGLSAFVLDVSKGMLPVLAARHWYPGHPWIQVFTGLAAIFGHNNSVFLKFTGGKGVATSSGVTIALSWKAAVAGFAVWAGVTYVTGFISLGSIISAPVTGFLIWKLNHASLPYGLFGLLVALSVIFKHRGNIKRLRAGTELSIRSRKLILASASPRRKELLATLGIKYEVLPSTVDESSLLEQFGNAAPEDVVCTLAMAKAKDVFQRSPKAVVVGSDTVVVIDGEILGKPIDHADAHKMLARLSGRTHEVFTGVAVVAKGSESVQADRTSVTFNQLSREEIEAYIATGEPMDKAGSYGIQNSEISPVASISGDYYNVVGLPLESTRQLLLPFFPNIAEAPAQP